MRSGLEDREVLRPADESLKDFAAWKAVIFEHCEARWMLVTNEPYCLMAGYMCSKDHCPRRVTEATLKQETEVPKP